jgi:hypothetical protein
MLLMLLSFQAVLPTSQMKADFVNATPSSEQINERKKIERQANIVKQYVKKNDSIYYISQGDMGYYKNVFSYLLMPNKVNFWCWSIGEPIFQGDIWTCNESVVNNLSSFNYVFIAKNDGQLTDQFLTQIDSKGKPKTLATGLYRIEMTSNSTIQITLVSRLSP